jgi:sec-independent protein translocase protein TatA
MFGIGMQEILVVLVIALVVIGPKKLPELAKSLGKGYGEFRRAFEEMKNTINVDVKTEEEKENLRRIHESDASTPPPAPEAMPEPSVTPAPIVEVEGDRPADGQAGASTEQQSSSGEDKNPGAAPPLPYDNQDEEVEGGGD